jgi:hypothetical protein
MAAPAELPTLIEGRMSVRISLGAGQSGDGDAALYSPPLVLRDPRPALEIAHHMPRTRAGGSPRGDTREIQFHAIEQER